MIENIYPNDWTIVMMSKIFDFSGGYTATRNDLGDNGIAYLHYGDIHTSDTTILDVDKNIDKIPKIDLKKEDKYSKFLLKHSDVVFVDASEDYDGVSKFIVVNNVKNIPLISGLHTIVAKDKEKHLDINYKRYVFQEHQVRKQFMFYSAGQKVKGINKENVKKIIIPIPPLEEQKKIANILSTWDRAIEINQEAIIYRKSLLSGLTKGLTKGYKKIEGFQESIWKNTSLVEVFIVRNEKKYASEDLPLYSFTIEDGVTPKSDRYNREFLVKGKKKYKVSKYQDLVFNPANLKYGAIAVNDNKEDVLISPIYETLVIKDTNKYDIDFFKYLLTHSEMIGFYKSKVEGTLIERSAVKVDAFLLFQFGVPSIEEQRKISKILKTIDKSINLMQKEVELLKLQKKGLMQKLLTGKIRVQS